jgi:hypothetical protein
VVAFADGTSSEPEDAGTPEEQQHRLRASVVQDSVVIIRNKANAGVLSLHKQPSSAGSDGSGGSPEPAACLPPISSTDTAAAAPPSEQPQQQQPRFSRSTSSMRRVQFSDVREA